MSYPFDQLASGKKPLGRVSIKQMMGLPAYHLIVLGCALALSLHIKEIPLWLSLGAVLTLIFALPSVKHKIQRPHTNRLKVIYKTLQLAFFVLGVVALWLTYGGYSTDIAIGFLVLCLCAKLWELYDERDGYVLLTLCLFVVASAFLWSQGLLLSLFAMLAVGANVLGLIALADPDNDKGAGRARTLGLLMLPSVPMLIVLFLFFPRIDPLWQVQLASKQATTGVSDSMSPGDFASLSKSTELAFRVEFDGAIPSRDELYWRGLIFHHFDGITWTQGDYSPRRWQATEPLPNWATMLQGVPDQRYRVILEPTQQRWLFALDYSRPEPRRRFVLTDEMTLRQTSPVTSQLHYEVGYYADAKITDISDTERHIDLQLPAGNPKTRQLAQKLYEKAGHDPARFVAAIRQYVIDNEFYYTLSPPALRSVRVDEFLFDSRQGFCEHYASSFVFMARAVGIPARVVTGYQGGQLGRDGTSFEIRQMDAHAWAEIWADGAWQRVDPTAFVAPERILDGMADFTQSAGADVFGEGLAGKWGYGQFQLVQSLRRVGDELGYYWQKDVVGFDSEQQKRSLFDRLNLKSLFGQMVVIVCALAVILGLFLSLVWWRRRVVHLFDQPVLALSKKLGKHDKALAKGASESVWAYLTRLGQDKDERFLALADEYRKWRFGRHSQNEQTADYKAAASAFAKKVARLDYKKPLAK